MELHIVKHGKELCTVCLGNAFQFGNALVNGNSGTGIGSVSDSGSNVLGTIGHFLVEHSIRVAVKLLPFLNSLVPCLSLGGILTSLQVFKGDFIGSDESGATTHLNGQVGQCETAFHAHVANGGAGIFHSITCGSGSGKLCHDIERHILGCCTLGQGSLHIDAHGLGLALENGLRGQHLSHLTGTDAHGNGAHCTMSRGVRVATHNGHSGQ